MNVSLNVMRGVFCAARRQARFAAAALLSFGLVAGSVSGAHAEGFVITEWSARGMALGGGAGGGMVARADDPSAVAYNPAGITQIPGTATQMGLAVSMLNFDLTRYDNGKTVSSSDQAWPIPHFYLTHQLNDKWWFGIGAFTRYGLGSQFPDNWTARSANTPLPPEMPLLSSGIKSVTLLSSTINPNIAYKINDIWSVSAGVSYTWGYLSLNEQYNLNLGAMDMGVGHADARIHAENGYAFGYNFGLHARFNDQWSAGLTYRASEDMTFDGSARFRFSGEGRALGQLKGLMQNCNADGKLSIPDVITLGVMYKPLPNLSFEGDVAYTVWSRYRNLTINMHSDTTPKFFEQKNWRDTWAFTFGVEYAPIDWLTLRAGFTYETSPLQDTNCYDYLVPSNGRNYYTLGAGFKYENWTLDLAYMYIDVRDINYKNRAGEQGGNALINTYAGKAHNSYAHNFGLTVGYKF